MKKEIKKIEKNEFDQIIPTNEIIKILNGINKAEEDMYIALDAAIKSEVEIFNDSEMFDLMHGGFNYTMSEIFDIEFESMSTLNEERFENLKTTKPLTQLFQNRYEKIKKVMEKLNQIFKQANMVNEIKSLNVLNKKFSSAVSSFLSCNE